MPRTIEEIRAVVVKAAMKHSYEDAAVYVGEEEWCLLYSQKMSSWSSLGLEHTPQTGSGKLMGFPLIRVKLTSYFRVI